MLSDEKCREIEGEVNYIRDCLRNGFRKECEYEIKACGKILEILGAKDGN